MPLRALTVDFNSYFASVEQQERPALRGHLPSKIAFLTLDCLWFGFTLKALLEVKRGNISNHRDYMTRSYALTFSAVTLRTWRLLFTSFSNLDPDTIYMIDAWMGFAPNLLLAEWLIARRKQVSA